MSLPESIGRYQIERRLGHGGMAVIFLAHDPVMRRPVAVKLLHKNLVGDPTFLERFQREVETLAALEHPGIVPIYDYGEYAGRPYYVMRYMPKGSLVDRLRHGTMPVTETAAIIRQIAPALDAAHRRSIIHRDIKPGNILFDNDDHAFLSDFGIVKIASSQNELSGSAVMGTPTYMSPELARGEADIDGRSDIYSLGVLIFRMWAGVAPFTASTPMGVAMKHVVDPVPNILSFKPGLPEGCNRLIQKAMAKNRSERFESATQLSATLDELARTGRWNERPHMDSIRQDLDDGQTEPFHPEAWDQPAARTNLPPQNSTFIGRETELARIDERLRSPECRLLTLLGPGGIGKTRLALEAAKHFLHDFSHGVYLVTLAPVASPDAFIPTIAESIGFTFYEPGQHTEQLTSYLRNKSMLLILDNFEHMIDQAGVISELLQHAPELKILVTSRERLNLTEEWIIQVYGMDVPEDPTPRDFPAYPAVQLFLDRARRISPDYLLKKADRPYIVRICQLIEGVPLAIELAAAWVRLLTLPEIASEIEQSLDFLTSSMRNVVPRHRSIRAVFNYSWDLLEEPEKRVFCRLAVFRGSFSRRAAVAVAGANLQALSTMVDKSLLEVQVNDRYEMKEIVRGYALEKLQEDPEAAEKLQEKHGAYYASILKTLERDLLGGTQMEAMNRLRFEYDNILAAWEWAVQTSQFDTLEQCHHPFYRFFEFRGRLIEGCRTFEDLADTLSEIQPQTSEIEHLYWIARARQGAFLYRLSRAEDAQTILTESVRFLRESGTPEEIGFALTYQGAVAYLLKQYPEAEVTLEESLAMLSNTTDRLGTAIAMHHLALIKKEAGDPESARALFERSLEINQEIGNPFGEAISLNNLGLVASELGELDEAWILHNRSLDIRETMEDRWGIANSLDGLGLIAASRGDLSDALYYFEESAAIYREFGDERRLNAALANHAMAQEQLQDP